MKSSIEDMTVEEIKTAVRQSFGQHIDDDTAQDIKYAAAHGTLMWTDKRLTITSIPRLNIFPIWD